MPFLGRADGVGPVHLPRAMPRSNKQDKYAFKAKVHPRINGKTFTADATERWACQHFPELGTPSEGLRYRLWRDEMFKAQQG